MATKPLQIESGGFDVDRVCREIVGKASRDGPEAFRDAEPEGELLVVARSAHGHRDRLAADPDLERLLDRNQVALLTSTRLSDGVDPAGGVR